MNTPLPILAMILAFASCDNVFAADTPDPKAFGGGHGCLAASVELRATADDYPTARTAALARGERAALAEVLDGLTLGGYGGGYGEGDEGGELPPPKVATVAIGGEVFEKPNYRAVGRWCFDTAALKNALDEREIPYLTAPPPLILLVAVFSQGGINRLWETDNPWRLAWATAADSLSPLRVKVAEGGLGDKGLLSAAQAVGGRVAPLAALGERYQADTVVVAELDADFRVRLLQVSGLAVRGGLNGVAFQAHGFADAVERVAAVMNERLRGRLFRPTAVARNLEITACFADRPGWHSLLATLERTPGIKKVGVNWLSRSRASLAVVANAAVGELRPQLEDGGLRFHKQADEIFLGDC